MNKKPSAHLGIVAIIVAGLALLAMWPRPAATEAVPWRLDFAAASTEARRLHKPVFVEFSATWCGPCQEMARTTWADPNVVAALADVIPVKVDVDAHQELAKEFGVQGIPFMAVLNADGSPMKSTAGLMSPKEFIAWLRGNGVSGQ